MIDPTIAPLAFYYHGDIFQVFLFSDWSIKWILFFDGGITGQASARTWKELPDDLQHNILWKIEYLKHLK